ncbi:YkvA family protein [Paenibacillus guangzhouensis]|uniref:YkvA family protein n=1 Tax=Paenibacillus guangzhouensis TaxID=1473112 RepID=UPI001266B7C0|nr:YkvA family protein [Paenibacillus guangzhouensis]
MLKKLIGWAKQLKGKVFVLFFAYKDPHTPWYAKLWAVCVVAYAFSPIDLIPDFIPVLGYLDDVILVPIGITIALRLIPLAVIKDCTIQAEERLLKGIPKNWFVGAIIILLWITTLLWVTIAAYRYVDRLL